ncbi:MAG: hypothetical protein FGM15_04005 [Chthoniobacterales bacterium]|nr:hypothetical protein [Chthoniobacterales bacterium]
MKTSCTWVREGGAWIEGAQLPVTDRAIRYGMAVFETIGVREGKTLFLAEHLALLHESARTLLSGALDAKLQGALDLPALEPDDNGILRLYVTAGDGSPADPVIASRVFALFESLGTVTMPDAQTARLHPERVAPFAHGRKTSNYWMQCAAQGGAANAGFDHALLADHEGRLVSAAFGNVFFVLDGKLCTPSLSLAVRPGVIRGWVMRRAGAEEVAFPADHLVEASEIFLCNSRLGVMPLHFEGIGPGAVGRALREEILREKLVP